MHVFLMIYDYFTCFCMFSGFLAYSHQLRAMLDLWFVMSHALFGRNIWNGTDLLTSIIRFLDIVAFATEQPLCLLITSLLEWVRLHGFAVVILLAGRFICIRLILLSNIHLLYWIKYINFRFLYIKIIKSNQPKNIA